MVEKEGKIVDIVFHNETNGYTVFNFETETELFTAVGNIFEPVKSKEYKISGDFKNHHKYGEQFVFSFYEEKELDDEAGIESFLASGAIKGVGPALAKEIVRLFGKKTFEIIENSPERLLEVPGVGRKKQESIVENIKRHRMLAQISVELKKLGISITLGAKLYNIYGEEAVEKVKKNPYILVDKEFAVGFLKIDEIAKNIGIESDSVIRVKAGINYILNRETLQGHCYLEEEDLTEKGMSLLGVSGESIREGIFNLVLEGEVVSEEFFGKNLIYPALYYEAEAFVARKLSDLAKSSVKPINTDINSLIDFTEKDLKMTFSKEQKTAVKEAAVNGSLVITGGPGTGKTTIVKGIISLFGRGELKTCLCAPTGRAAKRLSETGGTEALTIHRLLEYQMLPEDNRGFFGRNRENPIDGDVIIVDEVSMVDIVLMKHLLEAVKPGTRLIFVGDVDQLPSVGAGNVLGDIIKSERIAVIELREVFRQAQESMIVLNAHCINRGEEPKLNCKEGDFFFLERSTEKEAEETIVELCRKRLPNHYDVRDPLKEIQVLTPTKRGKLGTVNLNKVLQAAVNPPSPRLNERRYGDVVFREGDKVMQIKNNYEKAWISADLEEGTGIYNGDLGTIHSIDIEESLMKIMFYGDRLVKYSFDELDQIDMAYAVTVHKSQGSEFPIVVMPVSFVPPMLANRNLLYTAVTRGKDLVVLVGSVKRLSEFVKNIDTGKRNSNLAFKIENLYDREKIFEDL